ncbi:matrix metalloproteinase-19-like [Photinus pyralis]|uniref:matrix metalloproteinase-19-like n=1 Tax=Photinus pyralis TaxID=7054 RepID=UPI00126702BF|nr:matrix metalloproteinase-19-like [Photinus pyralis]
MNYLAYLFPVLFQIQNQTDNMNKSMVMNYLHDFGYLPITKATDNEMKAALQDYQYFIGMKPTGEMDNETMDMMLRPRCGKPDEEKERTKRYTFLGNSTWAKKDLLYRFDSYPLGINSNDVHAEFKRAFNAWAKYVKMSFKLVQNTETSDISINFRSLDGEGRSIGYALHPTHGVVILDKDETWTMEGEGVNLFQIAIHEIGHSLGLGHSSKRSSVMYPYYLGYNRNAGLDIDDIKGITTLYASHTSDARSPKGDNTELCRDPKIDTIFTAPDGYVYVLKNNQYWKFLPNFVMVDGPDLIQNRWPGLPSKIDAAFTSWNNVTIFYKGLYMWKYVLNKQFGEPKLIEDGYDKVPSHIDAAFIWSGSGHLYFFRGDKYWMYNSYKPLGMRVKYIFPLPIWYWNGVPNNINAATSIGGDTYFFKGRYYYKYDSMNRMVYAGYPRSTAKNLFRCT